MSEPKLKRNLSFVSMVALACEELLSVAGLQKHLTGFL